MTEIDKDILDQEIDPSKHTVKTLITSLYHEVKELRVDLERFEERRNDQYNKIELRLEKLETWKTEVISENKGKLDLTKWIGWLFAVGLGLLELYQLVSQSGGL